MGEACGRRVLTRSVCVTRDVCVTRACVDTRCAGDELLVITCAAHCRCADGAVHCVRAAQNAARADCNTPICRVRCARCVWAAQEMRRPTRGRLQQTELRRACSERGARTDVSAQHEEHEGGGERAGGRVDRAYHQIGSLQPAECGDHAATARARGVGIRGGGVGVRGGGRREVWWGSEGEGGRGGREEGERERGGELEGEGEGEGRGLSCCARAVRAGARRAGDAGAHAEVDEEGERVGHRPAGELVGEYPPARDESRRVKRVEQP